MILKTDLIAFAMPRALLTSHLFSVVKNLLSKMLNPQQLQRWSIIQVSEHNWIKSFRDVGNAAFPPLDENTKKKIIEKISADHKIPIMDTYKQLEENPFGPEGGIFNMEKFLYQSSKANQAIKSSQSYLKLMGEMKVWIIALNLFKIFQ